VRALPLEGLTIGITADRRADEQIQMLEQRGAKVVHGPTIRTMPVADSEPARVATRSLISQPPDYVVVSTAIGVRTWWSLADGWGVNDELLDAIASSYVVARGPKAAGAMAAVGAGVDWRSPSSMLAEVVEHLLSRNVAGARVALQLDGSGTADAAHDVLVSAGADVVVVPTYRWTLPRDPGPALRLIESVCTEKIDAVTFTAAPAIHNMFVLAEQEGVAESLRVALNGPVLAMCVGPVCREAATERGVLEAKEPRTARLGTMIKSLAEELENRRRVIVIGETKVEVQGALVRANAKSVLLVGRERELFDVLSRRAGVVLPRTVMLAEVWGARQTDPHVLEVAIGRLRRKLAPTGLSVEAVMRRGYRLTAS
jgi:uroporphyrinogen-III synthase